MNHRADVVEEPELDLLRQRVGLEVIVEPQRREVPPLLAGVKPIDGDDSIVAALIERPHDSASDQAGGAGYEYSPAVGHG